MKKIGGQAVIEGVMMKSDSKIAIAVRKNGKIKVKMQKFISLAQRNRLYSLPVIRGIITLFEMLVVGMKALSWSADQQGEKGDKLTIFQLIGTFAVAIGLVILLFIVLPYYLTKALIHEPNLAFNLLDGLFRVVIFFAYIAIIGLMKDMKRVFQYHGAEHKAVYCYEAGKKLTPENCINYSTKHPRCGTSFLVYVIVISIILFSLIKDPRWFVNIPLRIIFIPVIAGISFELLKLSARFRKNLLFRLLILPGIWTQKFTTREPDKKQLEVAISALKRVI